MKKARITKKNLNEKSFTNLEVIELISKLSMQVDMSGFSRCLDVIEDLTGDRNFTEKN